MQVATVAELSASIAHEINQPLASVVTNAHAAQTWLSHDPPNLERAQATLDRIIRDGHSAAEVLRRIRALFKEAAPVKALLDVNQIIDEVIGVLADELRDNSIIVETELEADLPLIEADHVQIQQTLINLVHNAIDAMHSVTDRTKSLVLSSRRQRDELLIQVRDHGFGIEDTTSSLNHSSRRRSQAWDGPVHLSLDRPGAWQPSLGDRERDAGTTFSFTLRCLRLRRRERAWRAIQSTPSDARAQAHGWRQAVVARQRAFQSATFEARGHCDRTSGRPVIGMTGNSGRSDRANRRSSNPSISGMPMSEIKQSMSDKPPCFQTIVADEYKRTS
jgi:hypothetical protein